VSDEADFYTQGGNVITPGSTVTWVFWWDEGANASNYQDVWIAVQNWTDINNSVPTLSLSGFGTTLGSQDPSGDLHIIHWRTITNNIVGDDVPPVIFAFNLIQIPSGS
jgi:hypothetical protein